MNTKIGIIDVGGGCRGVYAAGIFDYFLDNNIRFDLGIGVSAGSANIASFTAKQDRRNYKFYTEYALHPEYMGIKILSPKNLLLIWIMYMGLLQMMVANIQLIMTHIWIILWNSIL